MKLKKGLFGYLNFGLGSILLSVYLYTLFVSLCEYIEHKNGLSITIFGVNISFPISVVVLLILILLYVLIVYMKGKHVKKISDFRSYLKTLIYWFCTFLLLFCFIYRVYSLISGVDSVNRSVTKNLSEVFTMLLSGSVLGTGLISRLFTSIVVFFFNTFGVSPLVFFIINSSMFFAGTVFLVFSVKAVLGRLPSLGALGFIVFYSFDSSFIFDTKGHNLWFLLASLFVFILSYFFMLFYRKNPVVFFCLFTVIVAGIFVLRNFVYEEYSFDFSGALNHYLFFGFNDNIIYLNVALITVALSLFGFFKIFKRTTEDISFLSIMLLLTIAFFSLTYPDNSSLLFVYAMAGVLAGNGLKALLFEGYKSYSYAINVKNNDFNSGTGEKLIEETNTEIAEETTVPDLTVQPVEKSADESVEVIPEETVEETVTIPSEDSSIKPEVSMLQIEDINLNPEENECNNVVKNEQADVPVVKYLFNPLPVPKKHVKKEMDYAIEPQPNEMKFDFETNDDDDFDVV